MKKIFALNLLLMSAAAQAQELPYLAINNPDNNGTGNSAGLFSLNSTSTAFLHGSREWPTLSAKTNNGIATYIPDNSYSGRRVPRPAATRGTPRRPAIPTRRWWLSRR